MHSVTENKRVKTVKIIIRSSPQRLDLTRLRLSLGGRIDISGIKPVAMIQL